MKRRSFMALLGLAPIAAPVALRQAAASAGVIGPIGALQAAEQPFGRGVEAATPPGLPWIVEKLRDLHADDAEAKALERTPAPQRLDPDLAASRSLSLCAAMLIQRRRDAQRNLETVRRERLAQFKAEYGMEWTGVAAWLASAAGLCWKRAP